MHLSTSSTERMLSIYLALSQYPILSSRIHSRMRLELFERGFVNPQTFEVEVREKAILSQEREGLRNPYTDEPAVIWEQRLMAIRDQLTDFYFSYHLPFDLFEKLVEQVLQERGVIQHNTLLSFNPELAPQEMLFEQALAIEKMSPEEHDQLVPRLQEIKVVLIRTMISDQLRYINIAKEWFTVSDLAEIRRRKIGSGRIGGKAAGMLLAQRILKEVASDPLRSAITIPESYFLGSDLIYTFMSSNNLTHWNDQKYKTEEQMRVEYPLLRQEFLNGEFPPEIIEKLQSIIAAVGNQPLIVRSSSLLEDNFGTSFAGKYESIFCPNQGSIKENLQSLTRAIANVYATTLNPNALLYRRSKGLQDYDERMAILIQVVQGELMAGHYYLPYAAGVAFSRNQYRWAPQIRKEDGIIRLVWGLGTRAVDRVGNDFPRLVALSHPTLRPSSTTESIRRYSQQYVDLIDLKDNSFKSLPVQEAIQPDYPPLRYLVQIEQDGYFSSLRTGLLSREDRSHLIVTFEELLRRTSFAETMREMLQVLEKHYHAPVDVEFTARILNIEAIHPEVQICMIQCRPLSHLQVTQEIPLPTNLPPEDVIFSTRFMIPQGYLIGIRYVLFIAPEGYFQLSTTGTRIELERTIGKLNASLAGTRFICVGPGRWGTSNSDLGVHIDYGDIYNSRALVELSGEGVGIAPEPSLGTHFFQDLLEAQIYPLAITLDDPETIFNRDFFYKLPNHLQDWAPAVNPALLDTLRLIDVADYRADKTIKIVMNDEKSLAIAFLSADQEPDPGEQED
ncbi:MAG TPA: PEP/pyruvate-binding domain-containing protein [Anaerolineaceae bacterium]